MKKIYLTTDHCEEVLRNEILIGSDKAYDGTRKRFVFVPWMNEYRVKHDGTVIDSGQAVEELLEVYNEL
jgi:hypothetical protein